ncbi:unknown [Methanothermobacter thermautotrophicus str. Delta H]|uniref:Uncharacterized protein n=1 Tax=Methanothermobacter thermautotrophicus (strain ATCC 29096 / DSM 1053 / JCM 10044 / NBRC 100330 / Delta H) TaxID=187420 RepID=O26201_METTH|nr:unknown [Methanothermobacter thermautotrophicus str. Delta H]
MMRTILDGVLEVRSWLLDISVCVLTIISIFHGNLHQYREER